MTYPPQQPHQGHPPYGYGPPQGYPPPVPAYGPPPAAHGYGPPPPVHSPPPPVDRRLERGRKVQRFLRFVILIGVACAVVWGVVYFGFIWNGRPEKGDCLSSLTEEFAGFPIVACDDPSAAYEIVTYVTGGKYDTDLGACDDHPNGEVVKGGGGRKSTSRWEFCAVPLK